MATEWVEAIRDRRQQKDDFLESHPDSPIPADEREDFEGLAYFPPNEAYRFECRLREYDDKETVTVGTSSGGEREYARWGEFRFEVDGRPTSLQAYKADPEDDRLWVPFRDVTSGESTYGGGRYLDLEPDRHRLDDDTWVLDFNEAYNPTCAYSDRYECPLPPTENWLNVPIEAGEKAYRSG